MKNDLFSRILSDTDDDAELLDAWFSEREADRSLRSLPDDPLPFTVDAKRLAAAATPFDGDVERGQIRILSPEFAGDADAFPFVAVLDRWMEDLWLVAPFSPYSTPATPGEMASGVRFAGRRVLQCWNARTAHESLVSKSRVAGSLGESVRQDALALFRHIAAGTDLPETFRAPVGPPILSKADPRLAYLAESAARYEPLTAATRATEAALARAERLAELKNRVAAWFAGPKETVGTIVDRLKDFVFVPAYGTPAAALAAGDKSRETTETFRVPAFGVELDVKHASEEGKVRFVVYGTDGERDTVKLEEFAVVAKDGLLVGTIEDGVLVAEASAVADGFLLLDPESLEPVALEPKGE